jgi:hypothetical protein
MIIRLYELYQSDDTQNISIGKFRLISNFNYTGKYSKQTEEKATLSMAVVAHVVSAPAGALWRWRERAASAVPHAYRTGVGRR